MRIGIDLVEAARLEQAIRRYPKLAGRLFTTGELAYCNARPKPGQHLAARFAAKEAAFKALGSGWPYLSWHDAEVVSTPGAGPALKLKGKAAELAGGSHPALTIAHDGGFAVAQVIFGD